MLLRRSRYTTALKEWSQIDGKDGGESSKSEKYGHWDKNAVLKAFISVFIWLEWEFPLGVEKDKSWIDNIILD